MATLKELERKKISDYKIEPQIMVFDTLLGYDELLRIWYAKETFEDREPYSLSIYGLDLLGSKGELSHVATARYIGT